MKATPNLPASSRMQMPSGSIPSIKNPLKSKPLTMSAGVVGNKNHSIKGS